MNTWIDVAAVTTLFAEPRDTYYALRGWTR